MSLTASLWTSVSGLLAHGERMNVIGNNISNVNTVGFKGQRMAFQDFVYQYVGTANGMGQVGRGTSIGAIMNDFSQGATETTTDTTDIAIAGNGFFKVKPKNNDMNYYTRAGNFRFDKDGYLVDPHGYVLQGWGIDRDQANAAGTNRQNTKGIVGSGSPVDIKLDSFTCAPRHTTNMSTPLNLDNKQIKSEDDKCTDETDPFFALLKTWDATQDIPLGASSRAHQTTMEVYDEAGKMHKLTIYFDRVVDGNGKQNIDGNSIGEDYWEFIVTMDPSEDVRDFASSWDPTGTSPTLPNVPEKLKGLLGAGTLTFDSTGTMKDMSFFVPQTDPTVNSGAWWDANGNVNLDHFVAAPISSNGYPMFAPNFSGTAGLQNAYGYTETGDLDYTHPNVNASGRMIALDFGMRSTSGSWNFIGDDKGRLPATYIDSNGNNTGLVKASAMSSYVTRQQTDSRGNALWYNGTTTITGAAGATPPNTIDWPTNPTSSDATTWGHEYTITIGGTSYPMTFSTNGSAPPTLKATLSNPPSDATDLNFTANGVAFTYVRGDTTAAYPTGAEIKAATWGTPTPNGANYEYTDGNGNTLILTPAAIAAIGGANPPTSQEIKDYFTANAPVNIKEDIATATGGYNWDISDGKTVQTITGAGTNIGPNNMFVGNIQHDSTTDDATEYYWVSDDGKFRATTPRDSVTPPYTTPPVPGPWNPLMETVQASNKYFINGMDGQKELLDPKITSYEGGFYEHNGFKQDGYTYGDLRSVYVSSDGVLSGTYSNGVTLQLYQITLHDFPSTQNLRREGGNLFTETRESGVPSQGAAGTGTYGTTHGNSLEQSNVDLSREFVNMITTQRGFQANSKSITTVDTMLETVIMMKR